MKLHVLLLSCTLAGSGAAWAKLPPPSAAQQAKQAEAEAKKEAAAKKAQEEVLAAQDRAVANYHQNMAKNGGGDKSGKPK